MCIDEEQDDDDDVFCILYPPRMYLVSTMYNVQFVYLMCNVHFNVHGTYLHSSDYLHVQCKI